MLNYVVPPAQLTAFFEGQRGECGERPDEPGLTLLERSALRIFSLEWRKPADLAEALKRLGLKPPSLDGSAELESLCLLAVAPARLRALCPAADSPAAWPCLMQLAAEGEPGSGAAMVEISSGLVVLELGGSRVFNVLASHCPADLDPRVLPPGRHLRSHLADHPALIRHLPSGGRYEVHLDRSLAQSCLSSLTRTAAAFGIAFLQTAPKAACQQPNKEQVK